MTRTLLRAGVLAVAAVGFCVALSSGASADVVEPKSATQPAAASLLEQEAVKAVAAAPAVETPKAQPEATPAPEQVVRQAPPLAQTHLVPADTNVRPEPSVVDRVMHPLRMGFQRIGASLGRVVDACSVGFGSGAGAPVLAFAVLALAFPFIRTRVFMARGVTDEVVSDFLLVRELTPPG